MTKNLADIEKELQNKLGSVFSPLYTVEPNLENLQKVESILAEFLTAALDRVAWETHTAETPEKREKHCFNFDCPRCECDSEFNTAVAEQEQNFKSFME